MGYFTPPPEEEKNAYTSLRVMLAMEKLYES
jgi:hypothetical protein